jgi:hypothetical protein
MNPVDAIVITVPSYYPPQFYNYLEDDLNPRGYKVKIHQFDMGVMAGIEWAMPTAVVIFLSGAFFSSALQEAGKDSYSYVKKKLSEFIKKNREIKVTTIAASQSGQKLSQKYDQSRAISVRAMLHSDIKVTVLFDESVSNDEIDAMLDGMYEGLLQLYSSSHESKLEESVDSSRGEELFMIGSPEFRKWDILNKQMMFDKYRNK